MVRLAEGWSVEKEAGDGKCGQRPRHMADQADDGRRSRGGVPGIGSIRRRLSLRGDGSDEAGTGLGEWSAVGATGFAFTYLNSHFGATGKLANTVKVRAVGASTARGC